MLGALFRWRFTAFMMAATFALLTALCFSDSIAFMTNDRRYGADFSECIGRLVVGTYLLRSEGAAMQFSSVRSA